MIKKIIIVNRKKCKIFMKRKSPTAFSSSSSRYFLSHVGLGSPLTPSLYKRHYNDEDLHIPELSPQNKPNRRKSYVQFAESMGSTALIR